MNTLRPARLSPVHHALEQLYPNWGEVAGMPVQLDFGDRAGEAIQAQTLALCDVSALPRLTLKGPEVTAFLEGQGLPAPAEIYAWRSLEGGGLICRTGTTEVFVEEGVEGGPLDWLGRVLGAGRQGVYRVLRQDVSLLLCGSQAEEVLVQTCGYDLRQGVAKLVMTRIADVSCALLQRDLDGLAAYQLWADGSYGLYLWETLLA